METLLRTGLSSVAVWLVIALCILRFVYYCTAITVIVYIFPFAVLLNCFYPNTQILPFISQFSSPSHQGRGEWAASGSSCQMGLNHDTHVPNFHPLLSYKT